MLFAATVAGTLQYVLGGILILLAVALVVLILLQSAKDKRLSGTIAGGAETFFGKTKGTGADKLLSKLTIIAAALAVVVMIALVVITNNL